MSMGQQQYMQARPGPQQYAGQPGGIPNGTQPHTAPAQAPRKKRERKVLQIFDPDTKEEVVINDKTTTPASAATPAPTADTSKAASAVATAAAAAPTPTPAPAAAAPSTPKPRRALDIVDPTTDKPVDIGDKSKANGQAPAPKAAQAPAPAQAQAQTQAPKAAAAPAPAPTAAAPAKKEAAAPTPAPAPATSPVATAASPDADAAAPKEAPVLQDRSPEYPAGSWKPWDPSGKKAYPIDFLMKFQTVCKKLTVKQNVPDLDASRVAQVVNVKRDNTMRRRARGGGDDISTLSFIQGSGRRASTKKVIELPRRVEKLEKSENAWGRHGDQEVPDSEEALVDYNLKKATGILNKLTVEKFDKLSDELLKLGTEFPESSMTDFISRIFEKAVDESFFSGMYAQLCQKMANFKKQVNGKEVVVLPQFRKLLLNRCQIEFQKDRNDEKERLEKLAQEKKEKMAAALAKAEAKGTKAVDQMPEVKEAKELDEEEYQLKKNRRRMFGNIKFIGELYLRGMVCFGGGVGEGWGFLLPPFFCFFAIFLLFFLPCLVLPPFSVALATSLCLG